MSFNRSGYIGRAPGDSAITIAKQYFQPTSIGKTFTFSAGYSPGLIDVYRNGIKLVNVLDYAATDGSTIVLDTPVGVGSTVQVVAYKAFNLATVKATELDTSVTGTDLTLSGDFTADTVTATTALYVGSALTANAAGDVETIGIITAASFSGDGSALTGLANTDYIVSVATTTGDLKVGAAVTVGGIVNIDATTDSTSTSTGALIVDGGLGVAKNVYIGAGLSVAGTLTYEDVTSVDSVGLITAKSGVNITGGQLTVGSGITMGIAGVATFSGTSDVHLLDNVQLNVGDGSDLVIKHDGSNSYITDSGSGGLFIQGSGGGAGITLEDPDGNNFLVCIDEGTGGAVELYKAGNKKLETTTTGATISGEATADGLIVGSGITMGSAGVTTYSNVGGGISFRDNVRLYMGNEGDFEIYNQGGSNTYIKHNNGAGDLMIYGADQVRLGSLTQDFLKLRPSGDASITAYSNAGNIAFIVNDGGAFDGGVDYRAGITTFNTGSKIIDVKNAELRVGSGITVAATSGVVTFANGSTTTNALHFGSPAELKIYHDGSNNYIRGEGDGLLSVRQMGTGDVELYSNVDARIRVNGGETAIECNMNSSVDLYHNNIVKLQTSSTGVSVAGTVTDSLGNLRDIPLRSVTGSAATLVAADAGKVVSTNTTGWTVPASTFSEGDTVTLLNNSAGGLTITCSAVTTYLTSDGTTVTSSTLGARGLATLYFVSSSVAYLQGTALS